MNVGALNGRTLSTLSFHDGTEWHLWIPAGEQLIKMKGWPAEGFYFSKQAENPSDVQLVFLEFIAQRACWPPVVPAFMGLRSDFFNITASLKKFDLLFEASKNHRTSMSRLVTTELEYLFSLCRSVFDLLQEVIAAQWETVKLIDESVNKKHLPKTFSKIVLDGERLRDAEEVSTKYFVPRELAEFYARSASFFQLLRTFRDRFIHGGTTIDVIFVTERGFAVHAATKPFSEFGVWNDNHKLPNELCSLRPAIAHIVNETLRACEDYAETVQRIIQYPPPVVPGFGFFMRGHFTDQLHKNSKVLSECLWWDDA